MGKEMTLSSVHNMVKDKNVLTAAQTLIQAIAYEKTVREVIEPAQQEVVDFFKFKIPEENKHLNRTSDTITNPKHMYLSDDEDFKLYLAEMDRIHREKGFEKPSPDHCPLLMAESLTREAKRVFVDLTAEYTGMDTDTILHSPDGFNSYKNYIRLTLNLLAPKLK